MCPVARVWAGKKEEKKWVIAPFYMLQGVILTGPAAAWPHIYSGLRKYRWLTEFNFRTILETYSVIEIFFEKIDEDRIISETREFNKAIRNLVKIRGLIMVKINRIPAFKCTDHMVYQKHTMMSAKFQVLTVAGLFELYKQDLKRTGLFEESKKK